MPDHQESALECRHRFRRFRDEKATSPNGTSMALSRNEKGRRYVGANRARPVVSEE